MVLWEGRDGIRLTFLGPIEIALLFFNPCISLFWYKEGVEALNLSISSLSSINYCLSPQLGVCSLEGEALEGV